MLAAASSGKKFFIMPVVTMSGPPVRVKAFPYFGSLPQVSFLRQCFFSASAKTKKRRAQFSAWGKSGRSRQTEIALRGHAEWEFF